MTALPSQLVSPGTLAQRLAGATLVSIATPAGRARRSGSFPQFQRLRNSAVRGSGNHRICHSQNSRRTDQPDRPVLCRDDSLVAPRPLIALVTGTTRCTRCSSARWPPHAGESLPSAGVLDDRHRQPLWRLLSLFQSHLPESEAIKPPSQALLREEFRLRLHRRRHPASPARGKAICRLRRGRILRALCEPGRILLQPVAAARIPVSSPSLLWLSSLTRRSTAD